MKIIYNDDLYCYIHNFKKDIIDALKDLEIEINEENINNEAVAMLEADEDYLKEALYNFDVNNKYDSILCVASFGLWYGCIEATKQFKTLSQAILSCCYDSNMIYFESKNKTLKMNSSHHDGVNKYMFYKIINNKKYAIKLNDLEGFY